MSIWSWFSREYHKVADAVHHEVQVAETAISNGVEELSHKAVVTARTVEDALRDQTTKLVDGIKKEAPAIEARASDLFKAAEHTLEPTAKKVVDFVVGVATKTANNAGLNPDHPDVKKAVIQSAASGGPQDMLAGAFAKAVLEQTTGWPPDGNVFQIPGGIFLKAADVQAFANASTINTASPTITDQEGYKIYVDMVKGLTGGASVSKVLADYFVRPEYERMYDTHEKYVTGLYNDLLGRQPDQGGLKHWSEYIRTGHSHSDVVKLIMASDEHVGIVGSINSDPYAS